MRSFCLFCLCLPLIAQDAMRPGSGFFKSDPLPKDGQALALYLNRYKEGFSDREFSVLDRHVRQVLARSDNRVKLSVANNYAVFLLRRERHQAALALLSELYDGLDLERELPATEAARCMYNFGRLLEADASSDRAMNWHTKAARLDADYEAPVQAMLTIARATGSTDDWRRLINLVRHHSSQNRQARAGQLLRAFLAMEKADLERLFAVDFAGNLRDFLVQAQIDPAQYRRFWSQDLQDAWARVGSPLVSWDPLKAIDTGAVPSTIVRNWMKVVVLTSMYEGRFDGSLRHASVQNRHLDKAAFGNQSLGEFAHMVGAQFLARQAYPQARNLLILSWSLDPSNTETGVLLSRVLLLGGKGIDPEGRVLDYLLQISFDAKGSAYLSKNDDMIYRYHVMLATIFQEQGIIEHDAAYWGARKQWALAVEAHGRLQRRQPDLWRPTPRLYESLAQSYLSGRNLRKADAHEALTTAAEQYVMLERRDLGRAAFVERAKLAIHTRSNRRESRLVNDLFMPKNGDRQLARSLADQVTWSASGGKTGKVMDFAGLDFSGYDFSGLNLSGVDFKNANLSQAMFRKVDLSNADLSATKTDGVVFDSVIRNGTRLPLDHGIQIRTFDLKAPIRTQPEFKPLESDGAMLKFDVKTLKQMQTTIKREND